MRLPEKVLAALRTVGKILIGIGIGIATAVVYVLVLSRRKVTSDVAGKIEDQTEANIAATRAEIAKESAEALARRANEWIARWGKSGDR